MRGDLTVQVELTNAKARIRELEVENAEWELGARERDKEIDDLRTRAEKAEAALTTQGLAMEGIRESNKTYQARVAELTSYIDAAISWLDGLHSNGAEALANLRKAREREEDE